MPYTVFCHVFVSNGRMVAKLIQTVFQCNQFRIAWLSSIKTALSVATIVPCSQASSFWQTSSVLCHVSGCVTAYIDLPGYHHQVQVPDVPLVPGYDVPLQLSISFCLFRSAVCQMQLRLLFSCGNPDTRNDLDLISAFSYVSMQMSCKMLLLLCLSYFYFGGFCICNKEF